MSDKTMIEAKNLWKSYGKTPVLENINVTVNAGEFVTVVGASGCGKTTFLKMMLGTEQPTKGTLSLDGKPMPEEPGPERGIVFQRYSVLPHLTVLRNVVLGLELEQSPVIARLFGDAKKAAEKEARHWLEAVGLTEHLDKYPHELSGGMQQRLALAQSLVKKPRILLLDEPFGALDPGIRKDMHKLVLDLWKEQGLTIFMITHDITEGFKLGTRLWVFDKVRHDPHDPQAFGATITYDLPVGKTDDESLQEIEQSVHRTSASVTARTPAKSDNAEGASL